MNPTPREFFRKHHSDDAAKLAILIHEPWFQRVVVAATAQMGHDGHSAEMQAGAKKFVAVLHALTEDDAATPEFPDHSKLETY